MRLSEFVIKNNGNNLNNGGLRDHVLEAVAELANKNWKLGLEWGRFSEKYNDEFSILLPPQSKNLPVYTNESVAKFVWEQIFANRFVDRHFEDYLRFAGASPGGNYARFGMYDASDSSKLKYNIYIRSVDEELIKELKEMMLREHYFR